MNDIRYTIEGRVATLSFNRPDKKNAITAAMYAAMADSLRAADADDAVRVIVIRGEGGVFTAGNDLQDFLQSPPAGNDSPVIRFMEALRDATKPVIASVSGVAVGIGTTLLMHCDLVYAAENARFALPFAQLGLCPEYASSLLLQQLAGYQRAAELLLFGEPFDADTAETIGLVNKQLAPALLEEFVSAQAAKLAAMPPDAVRTTKRLMKSAQAHSVSHSMQTELKEFMRLLSGPDAREAMSAFMEKRLPVFR